MIKSLTQILLIFYKPNTKYLCVGSQPSQAKLLLINASNHKYKFALLNNTTCATLKHETLHIHIIIWLRNMNPSTTT